MRAKNQQLSPREKIRGKTRRNTKLQKNKIRVEANFVLSGLL
jgi:hypothetical protein